MPFILHGVAGFSCPDPATGSSLINVSSWTEPPQVFLRAHVQPPLIYLMRPWSSSGTTPDATSQQAGALAELVVKVHAHLGLEAEEQS